MACHFATCRKHAARAALDAHKRAHGDYVKSGGLSRNIVTFFPLNCRSIISLSSLFKLFDTSLTTSCKMRVLALLAGIQAVGIFALPTAIKRAGTLSPPSSKNAPPDMRIDEAVAYPDSYKRADEAVAYPDSYKRTDDAVAYPDSYKRADDAVAYPDSYKRTDEAVAYPDSYKRADDAVAYPDSYKRADEAVAYPDSYKRADDAVAYPDSYKRADDAVAYPDSYKRTDEAVAYPDSYKQ